MGHAIDRTPVRRPAHWFAAVALALGAAGAQAAVIEGKTNEGNRYVVGGIGTDEVEAMRQEAPAFSLQLVTAARTGAYLAGTRVRITGPGNNVVLDMTLDAPWLLVDLPGGRYTVRATHSGNTVERRMTIAPGKPQRLVLQFEAPVDSEEPTQGRETADRSRVPQ